LSDATGKEVATIKKRFTLFHHKLDILSDFGDFVIDGDLFAHRFSITSNGKIVVDFSKKWVSWGDSYEISIFPEEHVDFYLALVIMIDNCLHDSSRQHHATINL
jgi:uncharacterized protein YxjI